MGAEKNAGFLNAVQGGYKSLGPLSKLLSGKHSWKGLNGAMNAAKGLKGVSGSPLSWGKRWNNVKGLLSEKGGDLAHLGAVGAGGLYAFNRIFPGRRNSFF